MMMFPQVVQQPPQNLALPTNDGGEQLPQVRNHEEEEPTAYVDHYKSTINDLMFFRDQIRIHKQQQEQGEEEAVAIGERTTESSDRQAAIDCVAASQEFGVEAQRTFPTLLYDMLNSAEEDGIDRIVSWLPHGRAFRIYDRSRFETEVMPK